MNTKSASILCVMSALLFCHAASAQAKMIFFCFEWQAQWADTGYGENRLVSLPAGQKGWIIPELQLIARTVADGETEFINVYTLDPNGCAAVTTLPDRQLVLTIPLVYPRSQNRNIRLLAQNAADWGAETPVVDAYEETFFTGMSAEPGETERVLIPDSEETRLMPVMYTFARFANTLNWPANTSIHVGFITEDEDICDGDDHSHTRDVIQNSTGEDIARICMRGPNLKYETLHEIGHAIAKLNHSHMAGDYRADRIAARPRYSRCAGVDSWNHHSREWTGTAASEGFAEFMSYAAQVYRDRTSPEMNARKLFLHYTDPIPYNNETGTHYRSDDLNPSSTAFLSPSESTRYSALLCPPPSDFTRLSSARDWIRFYWGIWAAENEDVRFEVSEINDLWETSLQTDRGLHTNCAPVTTTGEKGWTCVELPTKFEKKILWTNGPVTVKIPTTKYRTGPSWEQFRDAAYVDYIEDPNPTDPINDYDKYQHLLSMGLTAGVTYE